MPLELSPARVQAAYEYLAECRPMHTWNLPAGEDIIFRVGRSKQYRGFCRMDNDVHTIWISRTLITTSAELLLTVSHEMIHLYQNHHDVKSWCDYGGHDEMFWALARQLISEHGFDPRIF